MDILIPIYNAYEATVRCLQSVAQHTAPDHRLILVDDGSTDPRIRSLPITVRSPSNEGFVKAVNRGLRETRGDVILLNSDTLVSKGWIEGLTRALASDPRNGLVTPVSNAGFLTTLSEARAVPEYPELPSAVGFCMLIARPVIEAIGDFSLLFSPGYGEEIDYSFRAREKGFRIVCADDVFIYHEGAKSFGRNARTEALHRRAEYLLTKLWPQHYPHELMRFKLSRAGHRRTADTVPSLH